MVTVHADSQEKFTRNAMPSNELTLLIKCHSREKSLDIFLKSILHHEKDKYKVLVADDSANAAVATVCEKWKKNGLPVELIKQKLDAGLSAGRNLLMDRCGTRYGMILEEDFKFISPLATELLTSIKQVQATGLAIGILGCWINKKSWANLLILKGNRLVSARGQHKEIGNVRIVDLICNCYILDKENCSTRWDDVIKIREHLAHFWQLKKDNVIIGIDTRYRIRHYRARPNRQYIKDRNRNGYFKKAMQRKGLSSKWPLSQ
jgi:glycosyltransferase involved in cell wall biosynthesis